MVELSIRSPLIAFSAEGDVKLYTIHWTWYSRTP